MFIRKSILPQAFLMGLLLCLSHFTLAQTRFPNVMIDRQRPTDRYAPCEPSIAIDPNQPDRIVAGAILDRVYTSADGGRTWQESALRSDMGVFGDPCVITDRNGNFYYFHLSDPEGKGWQSPLLLDRIVCQRSSDGGKSWTSGAAIGLNHPKDQDKEWAVADPATGALYVTWTQFDAYGSRNPEDRTVILFSRSDDRGDSWSEPVRVSSFSGVCIDDDGATEGAVPAVGADGQIFVSWSLNGKIYFNRSADGGRTWMARDTVIAFQPGGWDFEIPGLGRVNGFPVTVTDLSQGPHRGRLYVCWSDQRYGEDDTDIWLIHSDDGGRTWSQPLRVNDDQTRTHQFFHWLTVDPANGHLYAVFYDRRNATDTATEVYLARSTDGGLSFENIRVSESPFVPDPSVFFGDYTNISAVNGRVRPIWTRADGKQLSIWTALVEFKNE